MGYSIDPSHKPLQWWQAVIVFILVVGFWCLAGLGVVLFVSQFQ